ncbi:hypothetical protein Tco_1010457, partial [Tanacetum coccineum]
MFEMKFETSPDSPPIIVIDPDDQPMWSNTRNIAPTPSSAIVQIPIPNNFFIKADFLEISNLFQYGENQEEAIMLRTFPFSLSREDNPTQGILDAGGIFLYKTPNEAFKILKDKVLLSLDFSSESQNSPKPKTVVSASGSNISYDLAILVEEFEALATKNNSKLLIIRKDLKEMRDSHKDNHASQIYMSDDTPMCDPMEGNYVHGYHE